MNPGIGMGLERLHSVNTRLFKGDGPSEVWHNWGMEKICLKWGINKK